MWKKIAYIIAGLSVAGCSTYSDPIITKTKSNGSILNSEIAYFCQSASYATNESVYQGGEVLSNFLNFWGADDVLLVRFNTVSKNEFFTEYLDKDLNIRGSRRYIGGEDFQLESDGTVEIKDSSRCAGGDSPGIGCNWSKIRLLIDQSGNLAVIKEAGGAGIVGIVPVAVSGKYLSLFPPVAFNNGALNENFSKCPESKSSRDKAEALSKKVDPTFVVGDVVIPYRQYDYKRKTFNLGPTEGLAGTKWRVKEISYEYVRLELIEGEYKPRYSKDVSYKAGEFSTKFSSSDAYKATKPHAGNLGQTFEEFKKDN